MSVVSNDETLRVDEKDGKINVKKTSVKNRVRVLMIKHGYKYKAKNYNYFNVRKIISILG